MIDDQLIFLIILVFLIIYIAIFWQFHIIILSMHGHTGACCSKRIISWQSGEGKFTTICHCFSHSPLLCEIWQLISTTNLVYRLLVPSAVKSLHIGINPIIKKHLIWVMRYRFWKVSIQRILSQIRRKLKKMTSWRNKPIQATTSMYVCLH